MTRDMAGLGASLDALEASVLDQLSAALAPVHGLHDAHRLRALLEAPERLGTLLLAANAHDFAIVYRQALRVVKALCRLVMRCVAAAAEAEDTEYDHAVPLHLLDDALRLLLSPVAAFAQQAATHSEQPAQTEELVRWVPFASCASCFVRCGQLPDTELAQSAAAADRVLASCGLALGGADRAQVLAAFVAQIAALVAQGVSKEQWVAPRSVHKHVLLWVVERVASPHLGGDVLGRLLALALPLVDDLRDETQRVGARLVLHLVRNVTDTELRWYTDALLEVLRVGITTRQPATLDCLLACLAEALAKASPPGDIRLYDRFVPRLLTDASLSSDVAVRAALLRRLRPMVERIGAPRSLHLVRYLQPLLKVLAASFDCVDADLLAEALQTLRVTVLGAWPRIPRHVEQILVAVLRAVAFCELFDDGVGSFAATPEHKKRLLPLCEDVISLLYDIDGPQVRSMLRTVGSDCAGLRPFADRLLERVEAAERTPRR